MQKNKQIYIYSPKAKYTTCEYLKCVSAFSILSQIKIYMKLIAYMHKSTIFMVDGNQLDFSIN